jgi:hypothetical protein
VQSTTAPHPSARVPITPIIDILRFEARPTSKSLTWLGSKLKVNGQILMGLYAMLRGAEDKHADVIKAVTVEVLHRSRLDESNTTFCTNLVELVASFDVPTLKRAQNKLGLQCRELLMVSKRIMSPKDLPQGYLFKKAGFPNNHPLVRRRKMLAWDTDANGCLEWCKAVASAVMDTNQPILTKFMIRGQMMIAA